jgi:lysozyme family protein
MDCRFNHCVDIVIKHEGGLSDDKRDPGGTTNWGISLRYLRTIGLDINGDGEIDATDIIGLPILGAKEIYKKYWWDTFHYERFEELLVVEKVFDLAVNMGGYAAHKLLQIAINRLSEKPIKVDGLLGDRTFAAANSLKGEELRQELRACARHEYTRILVYHPKMEWARNGWMNRAEW